MTVGDNNSLQPTDTAGASFRRGMGGSEYQKYYVDYFAANEGHAPWASEAPVEVDPIDQAIRQLHISVIPDRLACRDTERIKIESMILSGIHSKGSCKPLYVSGMPGPLFIHFKYSPPFTLYCRDWQDCYCRLHHPQT
jgi:hypothetical protein